MLPFYCTFYLKKGKGESIHQAACMCIYLCDPHLNFETDYRVLQNKSRYWRIFQCRYFLRPANSNPMTKEPSCDVAATPGPLSLGSCTNVWSHSLMEHFVRLIIADQNYS